MIYYAWYKAKSIDRGIPVTPTNVFFVANLLGFWISIKYFSDIRQSHWTLKCRSLWQKKCAYINLTQSFFSKYMYNGYRSDSLQGNCRIIHVYVTWLHGQPQHHNASRQCVIDAYDCHGFIGILYNYIGTSKNMKRTNEAIKTRTAKVNTIPSKHSYKSPAGRYRPVSYPDGPMTARCRFIKNAYWVCVGITQCIDNTNTSSAVNTKRCDD